MACEYSNEHFFVAGRPEDGLVSPVRIAQKYLIGGASNEIDGLCEYGKGLDVCEKFQQCNVQDISGKDILELLPENPFELDFSSTFNVLSDWLEVLEVDCQGHRCDHSTTGDFNCQFITEFGMASHENSLLMPVAATSGRDFNVNFPLDLDYLSIKDPINELSFDAGCSCSDFFVQEDEAVEMNGLWILNQLPILYHDGDEFDCCCDDIIVKENDISEDESLWILNDSSTVYNDSVCTAEDECFGSPHPALTYAVSHLGIKDLLAVQAVCKSLHFTVRNDPLLWRRIHIDQPLNEKLTDESLLELASRAQGNLQCLILEDCPRITDDALKLIFRMNPRITKLSVPGCTRLSIEGILGILNEARVTHLRIGGLYGVTSAHFDAIKSLLSITDAYEGGKPHYYGKGNLYIPIDDDRAIDISECPRCQNLKMVYDCPLDACDGQACRACTLCIARCIQCGRCIHDGEYEESFCLEFICFQCWNQLLHS